MLRTIGTAHSSSHNSEQTGGGSSNVQLSIDMDLRNFFPQMESACGECDNEEDIVQTSPSSDFVTTNSQALGGSVCLKLSQQTRVKARLSYQKKWEQKYPCNNSKLGMLLLLCYYCGV